tara:strand:+ start:592 stop:1005 length:414 start_codon:yes stop_codon:yes gene_type:complete
MLGKPPRDPKTVGSFSELRMHYARLWEELDQAKRMQTASDSVARARTKEVRTAKAEVKKAHAEVVTLTKREHAKSKEKSSAAYSSTAATILIIFYQIMAITPHGWGRWEPVFQHEATIGVLQVIIGGIIAFAMRPLR